MDVVTARRRLVAANWKMQGQRQDSSGLLKHLIELLAENSSDVDVVICPPSLYVPMCAEILAGTDIALGAQNVHSEQQGAYTGEIAARMLTDFACRYVIVGHSERRTLFAESDAVVADKFAAIQSEGLIPIICVGETLEEREADRTAEVVDRQLDAVLKRHGVAALQNTVVAYEPVWAIGTGRSASAEQAQTVHAAIRAKVGALDTGVAEQLRILYGGSVKAANASAFFAMPDIDGALVGGASLDAKEFASICLGGA